MLSEKLGNVKDGTNIDLVFFLLNMVSERNEILPLRLYSALIHCVHRTLQQVPGKCQ